MTGRGAEARNGNGAEIGKGKRAEAGKENGAEAKNADAAVPGVEIADSEAAIEVPSRLLMWSCMCTASVYDVEALSFTLCFLCWSLIILEKVRGKGWRVSINMESRGGGQ